MWKVTHNAEDTKKVSDGREMLKNHYKSEHKIFRLLKKNATAFLRNFEQIRYFNINVLFIYMFVIYLYIWYDTK